MARPPAVAGLFYEPDATSLEGQVRSLLSPCGEPQDDETVGLMVPHAAYVYSGAIAGKTFSRVRVPDRVVIVGPNHTGLGPQVAVAQEGPWLTPLGEVALDLDFCCRLLNRGPIFQADDLAHMDEHSIEVQLPFLRMLNPKVKIVPICLRTISYDACEEVGRALGELLLHCGEPALIVASSDMNHHEPLQVAIRKDRMALDRVSALDPKGLYETVVAHHVTMCGFVAVTVMLVAARILGACHAEVIAYGTSADVNGDESSVVGYAGVLLSRRRPKVVPGFCLSVRK